MRLRRQWLAAVVLLAAVLAAPTRALPGGGLAPAAAASLAHSPAAPDDTYRVYLPYASRAPTIDLAISRVEVIQGVTMGDSYTVHIAGRQATLRAFLTLSGAPSLPGVYARLRRYVNGVQQNEVTVGPQVVYAAASEGNMAHTLNFNLPGAWLTTGSSYSAELDYPNAIDEFNEANNRYPSAGTQALNPVNMAPLNIMVVPVQYKGFSPPTLDLSYLTWMPAKVLPLSQINFTLRAPLGFGGNLTTTDGWSQLLSAMHSLHMAENPAGDRLYYGLVDSVQADGCSGGCIAGIGYISSMTTSGPIVAKTSAGFAGFPGSTSGRNAASTTFTHEMGHNFGRRHAPCGGPSGVDGSYPYGAALIGGWGYDSATGQLYNPSSTRDYMSYCGPEWTSDYTYYGIAQSWGWLTAAQAATAASSTEALLVNGYFDQDGRPHLEPLFTVAAAPAAPGASAHRAELLDDRGRVVAGVPLQLLETVIETPGQETYVTHFRALVPRLAAATGLRVVHADQAVYERVAVGAAPALAAAPTAHTQAAGGPASVRWQVTAGPADLHYRVRFSPDGGQTWTVLALDTPALLIEVPDELLIGATAPLVEVQGSDGVRVDQVVMTLEVP